MVKLESILAKLDKLTFISDSSKNTLESKEGFKVSLDTEFHHSNSYGGGHPSVQVILYVFYKGRKVSGWGCVNEEDTKTVVDWFLINESKAQKYEWDEEKKNEVTGKAIFDSLED